MTVEEQALVVPIDWDEGDQPNRCHDWRHHVGHNVRAIWDTLPDPVKIAIALDAEVLADHEEWD